MLGGCASYAPRPLSTLVDPAATVADLRHAAPVPERLDVADIVQLAIDNNPDLVAARTQLIGAKAEQRNAGILPNPVVSLSYADVLSGPGTVAALAGGILEDLKSLVLLSSTRAAAGNAVLATDASVLWQEWQLAGKARLQAVDVIQGEQQLQILRIDTQLSDRRLATGRVALQQGDTTWMALAPDIVAAADARKAFDEFDRAQQARRRDLALLLGLPADAPLPLTDETHLPPVDEEAIRARLPMLADYRPDLVALRAGYDAQEEKLRGAVLAQFPMFSLGMTAARDTSNVRTLGPQITFDLPVFDRNQGRIDRESGTREQLHEEFRARLLAATGQVQSLLADQALLRVQLIDKRTQLARMESTAAAVERSHRDGDLDTRTYIDIVTARNARRQDLVATQTLLLEQQVALDTLMGVGLRPVATPTVVSAP
jgi:outer membrane protein TolC